MRLPGTAMFLVKHRLAGTLAALAIAALGALGLGNAPATGCTAADAPADAALASAR